MGGETHQPQYQALYRACIKDAAAQGAALMQATLARALHELPPRAQALGDSKLSTCWPNTSSRWPKPFHRCSWPNSPTPSPASARPT